MNCSRLAVALPVVLLVSCGDDGGGGTGTDTSSGSGSGTPVTDSSATTPMSESSADDGPTSGSTAAADSTSSGGGSSSEGEDSTAGTTGPVGCEALPQGPFPAEAFFATAPFAGSEDFAFDGSGNIAGKFNNSIVLVDADGTVVDQTQDLGQAFGLRFRSGGDMVVAHPAVGSIDIVSFSAVPMPLLQSAGQVNGIFIDELDQVWFTNSTLVGRIATDGTPTALVMEPDAVGANGIVYDPVRTLLFYTNYGQGIVRRVPVLPEGGPGPVDILVEIEDAPNLDGMTMDGCGNLYVVDQGNSDIYRILLDVDGALLGQPQSILEDPTPTIITSIRFGPGDGFDELSLFAAGSPGVVYRIETGVGMFGVD